MCTLGGEGEIDDAMHWEIYEKYSNEAICNQFTSGDIFSITHRSRCGHLEIF
jgi:hypothetical protein